VLRTDPSDLRERLVEARDETLLELRRAELSRRPAEPLRDENTIVERPSPSRVDEVVADAFPLEERVRAVHGTLENARGFLGSRPSADLLGACHDVQLNDDESVAVPGGSLRCAVLRGAARRCGRLGRHLGREPDGERSAFRGCPLVAVDVAPPTARQLPRIGHAHRAQVANALPSGRVDCRRRPGDLSAEVFGQRRASAFGVERFPLRRRPRLGRINGRVEVRPGLPDDGREPVFLVSRQGRADRTASSTISRRRASSAPSRHHAPSSLRSRARSTTRSGVGSNGRGRSRSSDARRSLVCPNARAASNLQRSASRSWASPVNSPRLRAGT
jgi:hypothetical protein